MLYLLWPQEAYRRTMIPFDGLHKSAPLKRRGIVTFLATQKREPCGSRNGLCQGSF